MPQAEPQAKARSLPKVNAREALRSAEEQAKVSTQDIMRLM